MLFTSALPQDPHTAIIYPFEFSEDENDVGSQTIKRLECFADQIGRFRYNVQGVVLTAGFSPRHPRQRRTFAAMMAEWLIDHEIVPRERLHMSDNTSIWGSRGEIIEAIRVIKEDGLPRNIIAISTWNHIYPRLWFTWKILLAGKQDWNIQFASAWNCSVPFFHELMGTMMYVPWAIRHRAQNK